MISFLVLAVFVLIAPLNFGYLTYNQPSSYYNRYENGYYPPSYSSYYSPYNRGYQGVAGDYLGIHPGYGGWINPVGTGSGWAAGGGLVGNAISFFFG